MQQYHKINGVYKRDDKGAVLLGQYSQEEFEYLQYCDWWYTEKVDGTNICFQYRGHGPMVEPGYYHGGPTLEIKGKSDNADIPVFLMDALKPYAANMDLWREKFGNDDVCLYGEGYGAKIQKGGGNYIPDGNDFILFDVKIGDFWLKREDIEDIAEHLGMKVVPVLDTNLPLDYAIEWIKSVAASGGMNGQGFSQIAQTPNTIFEGVIAQPCVPLRSRNGQRIITKIKVVDFK